MPAFLFKDALTLIDCRMQDSVKVHAHKVFQVSYVSAGHRVNRLVRVSHCVQERLHRGLEQVNKRLFDRISIGSAENRVLQDVEDARVIYRRCFKSNGKRAVVIVAGKPHKAGTCGNVLKDVRVTRNLVNPLSRDYLKAFVFCVKRANRKRTVHLRILRRHKLPIYTKTYVSINAVFRAILP